MDYFKLRCPCIIFDLSDFKNSIEGFRNAIKKNFDKVEVGYSVKTNSIPYAISEAGKLGCLAEVVSHDEFELALECGFSPSKLIYNGPLKSESTFLDAIISGGIVNIETKKELQWLKKLPQNGNFKVGLRLNVNISHISPEDADGEDDNSRFGFSDESDEFFDALNYISNLENVTLAGLHIHRTTHSRSPRFYANSVDFAAKTIKKYNLNLEYLDIGGGYFGPFPNKPTFDDYSSVIFDALKSYNLENLKIIIEPGNASVATAFSFLSEVIDYKRVDDKTRFVTIDASRNDVDPFFQKKDYFKEIFFKDNQKREIEKLQVIGGCTCLEYDRLFSLCDFPALLPGDRILFNKVGAYTSALTPPFIRFFPRVYAVDKDEKILLVRKEWTAKDLMINSVL